MPDTAREPSEAVPAESDPANDPVAAPTDPATTDERLEAPATLNVPAFIGQIARGINHKLRSHLAELNGGRVAAISCRLPDGRTVNRDRHRPFDNKIVPSRGRVAAFGVELAVGAARHNHESGRTAGIGLVFPTANDIVMPIGIHRLHTRTWRENADFLGFARGTGAGAIGWKLNLSAERREFNGGRRAFRRSIAALRRAENGCVRTQNRSGGQRRRVRVEIVLRRQIVRDLNIAA